MNFLSKLSLYDILAMIVPGFIILLWGLSMCKLSWMPNTFEVDNSIIWAIWLIAAYLIGIINHVLTSRIWNKTRNNYDFLAETLRNTKKEIKDYKYLPQKEYSYTKQLHVTIPCIYLLAAIVVACFLQASSIKVENVYIYIPELLSLAAFSFLLYFSFKGIDPSVAPSKENHEILNLYYEAYYYASKNGYNNDVSIIEGQVAFMQSMIIPISLFLILPKSLYPYMPYPEFICILKGFLLLLCIVLILVIPNRVKKIHYLIWCNFEYLKRLPDVAP